jgi:Tol biopolymer transport system component
LWGEIKRRKVFRVAAVYAVVGWLIIQVVSAVAEPLRLPDWLETVTIVLLIAGFPIAVILAWAFDITPGGIVSTPPPTATDSKAQAGLRFSYVIQSLVLLAVGFLIVDQYLLDRPTADSFETVPPNTQGYVNRFDLPLPAGRSIRAATAGAIALSPDGRRFVYNTDEGLYLRSMDTLEARLIPGTEERVWSPAFTSDGQSIVYATEQGLMRTSIDSRVRVSLAQSDALDGRSAPRPAPDGSVLYYENRRGVLRANDSGGEPELLFEIPETYEAFAPALLPDGDAVLFSMAPRGGNSWNNSEIVLRILSSGEQRVLVERGSDARFIPTGHIVYRTGDVLYGIAFDPDSYTGTGVPVPLVQGILGPGPGVDLPAANFDVSSDGTLVYLMGASGGRSFSTLTWIDRAGTEAPLGFDARVFAYPRLSPDGSRIAFATREGDPEIWVGDLTRLSLTRLTDGDVGLSPVWSPDGTRVIYGERRGISWRRADGSAPAERLVEFDERLPANDFYYPRSISPDGRLLLTSSGEPPRDIRLLRLGTDVDAAPLIAAEGEQISPELSSDGRWLAYDSSESGRLEIYVRPYPNIGDSRTQVSTNGGRDPLFSRDGTELFYWVDPGTIMSVAIETGPAGDLVAGLPRIIVQGAYIRENAARQYDATSDGSRFVVLKRTAAATASDAEPTRIVVVQNWFDELMQLIPTD